MSSSFWGTTLLAAVLKTVSDADWVAPPDVAEIDRMVDGAELLAVTVKLVDVVPAGTVTLAGTVAAEVLLLARVTNVPPLGAGPPSVTVPCEMLPPRTVLGFSVTDEAPVRGKTVSEVVVVTPPKPAEIVTGVDVVTALVVTVNVALVDPAGTMTLAGTVAAEVLLLDSVTAAPPDGAAPLRVTVPCDVPPPTTLLGLNVSPLATTTPGPSTLISAKPMFVPTALVTWNCTQVTVRAGNVTVSPAPLFGKAPTDTVLPSLKLSVPANMLSSRLGRSYKTICETCCELAQVKRIHAPANCLIVAHSFV